MKILPNAHWVISLVLAASLIPAFHHAHLPLLFDWGSYVYTYYWALFFQSLMLSILLYAIGYPKDCWHAISSRAGERVNPVEVAQNIFFPATYLFFVFVLTFSYNDVIATFRFDGSMDIVLNRLDSWLLHGATVASISRLTRPSAFKWLEAVYFGMFPQVGACLFFVALREGRKRAWQFTGAIATAYFIGLACFYFVPATGPYYLSFLNHSGYIGSGELAFANMLMAIRNHRGLAAIGTDYFVAFPCLHLTQPMIVLWFLRKSKRIVAVLLAYDLAMVLAILLLQQHYVVDLIGGASVALLAVAIVDWPNLSASRSLE